MKIAHFALWTNQLEDMKIFYVKYFHAASNEKYYNDKKNSALIFFRSMTGAKLELMQMPGIPDNKNNVMLQNIGLIHFAFSTGSKENVDSLTEQIRAAGYAVIGEPRWTGDGYYESVVLDPENNRIEITI